MSVLNTMDDTCAVTESPPQATIMLIATSLFERGMSVCATDCAPVEISKNPLIMGDTSSVKFPKSPIRKDRGAARMLVTPTAERTLTTTENRTIHPPITSPEFMESRTESVRS